MSFSFHPSGSSLASFFSSLWSLLSMVFLSSWKIQKSLICSDEKVTRGLKTTEIMPSLFKSEVNLAVLFLFGCELHLSCHLLACKLVVWNPGNSKISDDSFSDAALAASSSCLSHKSLPVQPCDSCQARMLKQVG